MKVIGITDNETLICVVGHFELEKFMNLYYGKMPKLSIGDEIDLGKGYDFARDTANALRTTQEFIRANQTVVTAILNGLCYARLPVPEHE
ncbi:hypothetical protein [Bradyrhizobium sp.]|uniref:hypothetical protein n=1 Tax=Bradyrhizobium sp. TaxID=376 RepID=UPI003C4F5F51